MGDTTAVGYIRISNDPLGKRAGVDRQRADVLALAARKGLVPVIYEDNDESATTGRRPEYHRLMADLASGRIGHVFAWSQDRLGRSPSEWEAVIRVAREHSVIVATCTDGEFDLGTVSGRLTTRIKASVSASEVEQLSERVKAAARHRALAGKASSRPGYGFRRVQDLDPKGIPTGWRDEVDPTEAAVILEVADRVLLGESLAGICRDLNERGIPAPSGKPGVAWVPATIRVQLASPRLTGLRVHQKQVIGETEAGPILDRPTWDRIQSTLSDPARRTGGDTRARHLLTGVGRCGKCGGKIYVTQAMAYQCRDGGCFARKVGTADSWVVAVVAWGLSNPAAQEILAGGDGTARAAAAEVEELNARLTEARTLAVSGSLSLGSLAALETGLTPLLEAAVGRLRAASAVPDLHDLAGYRDAEARFLELPITRQRSILASLIEVRFYPQGKGRYRDFDRKTVDVVWRVPALDPTH